jgi:hypothetical protein
MNLNFCNPVTLSPIDIRPGTATPMKVVAVAHGPYWTAYRGPSDWSDRDVAEHGDKLLESVARGLFYAFANSGLKYND